MTATLTAPTERLQEARDQLQRISPEALKGDKAANKRASELLAEIADAERQNTLETLAAQEAARREAEQRTIEEAARVARLEAELADLNARSQAARREYDTAISSALAPLQRVIDAEMAAQTIETRLLRAAGEEHQRSERFITSRDFAASLVKLRLGFLLPTLGDLPLTDVQVIAPALLRWAGAAEDEIAEADQPRLHRAATRELDERRAAEEREALNAARAEQQEEAAAKRAAVQHENGDVIVRGGTLADAIAAAEESHDAPITQENWQ